MERVFVGQCKPPQTLHSDCTSPVSFTVQNYFHGVLALLSQPSPKTQLFKDIISSKGREHKLYYGETGN